MRDAIGTGPWSKPGRAAGLAALLFALAAPARAEELVRWIAPAPGSALVAGTSVTLEWAPGPAMAAFARAEEWEVFLSLDGGDRYLFRLTPHLDVAVRRVSVRLPDLPSPEARLLLRMGDERIEREQVIPGRYRIALPRSPDVLPRRRALQRGEPARPGEPGVLAWSEGDRRGGRRIECEAPAPPVLAAVASGGAPASLLAAPDPRRAPGVVRAHRRAGLPPRASAVKRPDAAGDSRALSLSRLRRRNE